VKIEDIRIGASETAAPLGLSPWESPFEWYSRKVGDIDDDEEESEHARLGKFLEAGIAAAFEDEHGVKLDPFVDGTVQFVHPEFPWMQARPDRIVRFDDMTAEFRRKFNIDPGEHVLVEIKTTGLASAIPKYIIDDKWGAPGTDVVPVDYATQTQQQINIVDAVERANGTGFVRRAVIKALIPGRGVPEYSIIGDMKVRAFVNDELRRIVREHLIPEVPLPPKTKDDYELLLKTRRQPGNAEKIVVKSTPEFDSLVAQFRVARELREQYEADEAKAKAAIVEWIGERYGVEGAWGKVLYTIGGVTERIARKHLVDDAIALMSAEARSEDYKRAKLAQAFLDLVKKHTKKSVSGRALRPTFKEGK
jgi:hypothetical protein